jgi:branched-chain amino acid transport system permease protein
MTEFLQLSVAGLALGTRYALVALGFVVIYAATGVINFAQGSFVAIGAYLTFNFHQTWGLPFVVAVLLAVVVGAAVGAGTERVVMHRMVGRPLFALIMITVGVLFVLNEVVTWIWGQQTVDLGDPWGQDKVTVADVVVPVRDLWTIGIAAAVLGAFFAFFRLSNLGIAMRATAADQEAAAARGVDVRGIFALSWAVAAGVAALAGVTLAAGPASLSPGIWIVALAAFPAMVLGGLDSPGGAVIGGVAIGLAQTLTAGYQPDDLPWLGENFYVIMPYLLMMVVLLVRPNGLFGSKEVVRL